jgi:hypothetical protein
MLTAFIVVALMMEAANTSETSVNFYPSTQCSLQVVRFTFYCRTCFEGPAACNLARNSHLDVYEDGLERREGVAVEVCPGCDETSAEVGRGLVNLVQQETDGSRQKCVLVVLEYERAGLRALQNFDVVV